MLAFYLTAGADTGLCVAVLVLFSGSATALSTVCLPYLFPTDFKFSSTIILLYLYHWVVMKLTFFTFSPLRVRALVFVPGR